MRFFLSAGEASGETYGALLMEALRRHAATTQSELRFFGLGGEKMRHAGCELVVDSADVAFIGLTEVIAHLPGIYRKYRRLVHSIDAQRPDAGILIDFPEVNLRLAAELHKREIPCIYFVSPQLWAWKKWRIKKVREHVSRMLVIFPFEEQFYRERGVEAEYVGHPLADLPAPQIAREDFARQFSLDPGKEWIGLLPGSRRAEVSFNLPTMLQAAEELGSDYEFVLPVASTLDTAWVYRHLPASAGPRITLVNDARATLQHARASVVASGTATVEAALIGNPFIVVYRLSRLTYATLRRIVDVPYVAMANLIAARKVVPELLQNDFTAANVVARIQPLLADGPERQTMIRDLADIRARLHLGGASDSSTAIERAAVAIWKTVSPGQAR